MANQSLKRCLAINKHTFGGDTSTMKLWISPASRYLDKEAELVLNIEASWLESARENRSRERDEDKTYQGW